MATTIKLFIISIFFTLCIIISSAKPTMIEDFEEILLENYSIHKKRELHKTNLQSSKTFQCKPQPRSYLSSDIFEEGKDASIQIIPNNYVLYRCDSQSGCCLQPNEVCGKHKEEVTKLMFQLWNKVNQKTEYKLLHIMNHTECKCTRNIEQPVRYPEVKLQPLTSAGVATNGANNTKSIFFIFITILIQLFILL